MPAPRSPDTPFLSDSGDTFRPAEADRTLRVEAEPGLAGLVDDAVAAMSAGGDTAEDSYQRTLNALRERGSEAVAALSATYAGLPEDHYLERWSVVQLLTDLRMGGAVDVLGSVLATPIPDERSTDPAHGMSTVGEEVIIRTTAVEALGRLIADGNQAARRILLDHLRHEVFSVRRAVVAAAMGSGDQRLRSEVTEALAGSGEEWLLELRRPDVRDVPQADGRQFLRERDPAIAARPPEPHS